MIDYNWLVMGIKNLMIFFNTIGDCILSEGLPGMINILSTLFVQAGVTPAVNGIKHIYRSSICNVRVIQSKSPNSCLKSQRLLNDADYDKMTCMLPLHLLAVTIFWERNFKIQSIKAFFAAFLITLQHLAPYYPQTRGGGKKGYL